MGYRDILVGLLIVGCANAQIYNVCVPSSDPITCQNLEREGSQVSCQSVPTRAECALRLSSGRAHFGVFSEEELFLLTQRQPLEHRVVGTVRDVNRLEPYSFEAVAVVPVTHGVGFEGLRGSRYCHPGFGASDVRWSPRVLRTIETLAARTDRCTGETDGKTAEELEVEILSEFFSEGCRPGPWSWNSTHDAELKSKYPNLCSMCTAEGTCAGYSSASMVNIAGSSNTNSHILALDCLVSNGSVALAAWTHVRDFFTIRNPHLASYYNLLCEDGSLAPLTENNLNSATAPCSLVRQPWSAIVATTASADALSTSLRTWFPSGGDPGGNVWQSYLFAVIAGGANARLVFEDSPLLSPLNYTSSIRRIADIDSTSGCLPPRRWCTSSAQEQEKCNWVRSAAYSLGVQPQLSCQQRASVFDCLEDVKDDRADFFSADTHYGYLARQHYRLSPVKLVQNLRDYMSKVAVLVKETSTANISRFENLRDKVACFPEFGGLAYVAFLRIAQQSGVISDTECDYAKAVGEFFQSGCAPGALDAAHAISDPTDFDVTNLCTACRPNPVFSTDNFTCAWNSSNLYYGNAGSLLCLSDPATDVAVVELQNITGQFASQNLLPSNYRALCANNSLATNAGVDIPDDCLIAHVIDAEVLMRRNSPHFNSVNTLLDSLDEFFGYNTAAAQQLINLHLYSSFDGVSDLLFKDSTIGLTEPTVDSAYPQAKNYIELFRHLQDCNNAAGTGSYAKMWFPMLSFLISALLTRYVVY